MAMLGPRLELGLNHVYVPCEFVPNLVALIRTDFEPKMYFVQKTVELNKSRHKL